MEIFFTKTYQKVGLFLMAVPRPFEFLEGSVWCVVLLFHHSVYLFFEAIPSPIILLMNVSLSIAPLGSIPELAAESCKEIKASEGQQAVSDWYWIHSAKQGKAVLAYCDMETEGGVDPCYNYHTLSDADRRSSYVTPYHGPAFCDNQPFEGWYRFVGDAGTKMPTTRVPAFRCGTTWSGWLDDAHPTVEDGEAYKKVCFSDRSTGCEHSVQISVKNCGSLFIYKLIKPPKCDSRYCSTD